MKKKEEPHTHENIYTVLLLLSVFGGALFVITIHSLHAHKVLLADLQARLDDLDLPTKECRDDHTMNVWWKPEDQNPDLDISKDCRWPWEWDTEKEPEHLDAHWECVEYDNLTTISYHAGGYKNTVTIPHEDWEKGKTAMLPVEYNPWRIEKINITVDAITTQWNVCTKEALIRYKEVNLK